MLLQISSFIKAQNCKLFNENIKKLCGITCINITLKTPNLKSTSNYKVNNVIYKPFDFVTPLGFEDPYIYITTGLNSNPISMPFNFCFYDTTFNFLTFASNGSLTFDTTNNHGCFSNFTVINPIPYALGSPCSPQADNVPKAGIMGVFTDLDPRNSFQKPSAPDRKIEYRVEGQAPCRKFIVSYYKIGTWGTWGDAGCWPDGQATFQMVLYESSGLIEIYVKNYTCPPVYSAGYKAILGIQNWARNKAVSPLGKNATGWTAVNEAYQFIPSGGSTRFINSKLYTLSGSFVANADTTSTADGLLNLNFGTICPPNDTTKYIVKTSFTACPNNDIITYEDTISLIKTSGISATLTTVGSCTNNGSITVNAIGDIFTYSLNGGIPQASNVFTNVPNGANTVLVTGNSTGCSVTLNANITNNNLILQSINDTTICQGNTINLTTISNATQYNWQPSTGLNATNVLSPETTPNNSTQYIVTASTGSCIKKDTVNITVLPKPLVNAGTDITVINGEDGLLDGQINNATNYIWSPNTYLNFTTILNPIATKPLSTILYKLTATANNGCKATDEVLVTVLPYCINPSQAFTPNGDGFNDVWKVYNDFSCLKNAAVKVFNRYGALVYENKNYNNNWQGIYNNNPIPDGTYYYVIDYTFLTNKKFIAKGNVTVLR